MFDPNHYKMNNKVAQELYNDICNKVSELSRLVYKLRDLPANDLYNFPSCVKQGGHSDFGMTLASIAQTYTDAYVKGMVAKETVQSKEIWMLQREGFKYSKSLNPWSDYEAIAFSEQEAKEKFTFLENKVHPRGCIGGETKKYTYKVYHFKDGITTPIDVTSWRETNV